ncbi:MAG: DUF2190 family protein [Sphingomonas sp.]
MKNFIMAACAVTLIAPYDVVSGAGCLVGHLFGVAMSDAADGDYVVLQLDGAYALKKHAGDTPAAGALIYWDDANKVATTASTAGNFLIGAAIAAAAGADATVDVRLNGVSVVATA